MVDHQNKPRSPREIFEAKRQHAFQAEQDRQGRLVTFIEGQMLERPYEAHNRLGFTIPSDDFPTEFGCDQYRILDYVTKVYAGSDWRIDDGCTQDGKSLIGFTAISGD